MQDLLAMKSRFTRWRLRSPLCAALDVVAALAGAGLFVVAAVDSVASWPSDKVMLTDPQLSRIAGIVLPPAWFWMIASTVMIYGMRRRPHAAGPARSRPRLPPLGRVAMVVCAVVCAAVVVGSFAVGADKGSARIIPGPRYEVSILDLNDARWTRVTPAEYRIWQARFVREDGVFTAFGLILAGVSLGFLRLRRTAAADNGLGFLPQK
jgi:hypothetical protein